MPFEHKRFNRFILTYRINLTREFVYELQSYLSVFFNMHYGYGSVSLKFGQGAARRKADFVVSWDAITSVVCYYDTENCDAADLVDIQKILLDLDVDWIL